MKFGMAGHAVGRVAELWRYPVKSMLGERRNQLPITSGGALGDRAWALRETATGRIASAKRFPKLLGFYARYDVEPTLVAPGRIQISLPDGSTICPDDPDASAILSSLLGHSVRLENQPGSDEKTGIDRATVFGDVPVSSMKAEWTPESMPDYFQLMKDTFFEIGAVFLLASGSVDHLRKLQGGTAQIDRRRFRPNIYIESADESVGFVEDSWLGGALDLGGTVRVEGFQPTLWCVTSTLAQEELPRDLSILRTAAKHHRGCLGVYATVTKSGLLQVGDVAYLVNQATDASRSMPGSASALKKLSVRLQRQRERM